MKNLFGRRKIYTAIENITADNVLSEVNKVLAVHYSNLREEEYLFWYRRGRQPVLDKKKEVRPEINNKVVENLASSIVAFKNGFFLTKPTFYVSRREDEKLSEEVQKLNDYLYLSGKHEADNALVDWFHTTGVAPLYVESNDDESAPMKCYALDPRQAFVVYSLRPGTAPVMAINVLKVDEDKKGVVALKFDVYTKNYIFRLSGGNVCDNKRIKNSIGIALSVDSVESNVLGEIPIIEYSYDRNRMSAFEPVLSILDTINYQQSLRLDSTEQFVNNLLVFYNCQLGEDEDGNPITPKMIREQGAIYLKSIGQEKADVKDITSVLDQGQTQVFINDLLKQVCDISGVPLSQATDKSTSDNVGAVSLRNGWQSAETFARNTEDIFRESNKYFDRIFLKILAAKGLIENIKPEDISIQFTRGETDNLLVKTQGALNLKTLGFSPELCLERSGLSNDPVGDVAKSKEYMDIAFATEGKEIQSGIEGTMGVDNGEDNANPRSDKRN